MSINICEKHNGKVIYETGGCPVCSEIDVTMDKQNTIEAMERSRKEIEDAHDEVDCANENEMYSLKGKIASDQQLIKDLATELRISNQWIKEMRPHLGDDMNLRRREADTQVRFNEALIERAKK